MYHNTTVFIINLLHFRWWLQLKFVVKDLKLSLMLSFDVQSRRGPEIKSRYLLSTQAKLQFNVMLHVSNQVIRCFARFLEKIAWCNNSHKQLLGFI